MSEWQSDDPVLLGGGRTDHMGKGEAERLHEQSKHASGRIVPKRSVSSTLLQLREKARQYLRGGRPATDGPTLLHKGEI